MFGIENGIIVASFLLFMGLDAVKPARDYVPSKWWKTRGLISAAAYLTVASFAPFMWADWLGEYRLVDATALPLALAVVLAYAVSQLVSYCWHRLMHHSDLLWRTFHQMHHSAERMDVYGSLYFHPLDMLGFVFVGSFSLTLVLGVSAQVAAIVGVSGAIIAIFTHANLKTPRWLGFLIQRPESHGLHHERDRHARNYCELPLWDMIFGTFANPTVEKEATEAGFFDGSSLRVVDMLRFRDISSKPEPTDGEVKTKPALPVYSLLEMTLLTIVSAGVGAAVYPII